MLLLPNVHTTLPLTDEQTNGQKFCFNFVFVPGDDDQGRSQGGEANGGMPPPPRFLRRKLTQLGVRVWEEYDILICSS